MIPTGLKENVCVHGSRSQVFSPGYFRMKCFCLHFQVCETWQKRIPSVNLSFMLEERSHVRHAIKNNQSISLSIQRWWSGGEKPADGCFLLKLFSFSLLPFLPSCSSSSRGMYFSGTPTPVLLLAPPISLLSVCLQLLSSPHWLELSPMWRSWWRITWRFSLWSGPIRYACINMKCNVAMETDITGWL